VLYTQALVRRGVLVGACARQMLQTLMQPSWTRSHHLVHVKWSLLGGHKCSHMHVRMHASQSGQVRICGNCRTPVNVFGRGMDAAVAMQSVDVCIDSIGKASTGLSIVWMELWYACTLVAQVEAAAGFAQVYC